MSRRGIPLIFYLLIALTGIATAICLSGWFRKYSVFFGGHIVSIFTIMVSGLLCMALGSYISGKVADMTRHRLIIFTIYSFITALYFLLNPVIYRLITGLFLRFNELWDLGSLGVGLLRFTLTVTGLLIPVGLLAGMLPLLIRHFIKNVGNSGRFMAAAVFAGSAGLLTGLQLSSMLLIPHFGVKITLLLGSTVYLLIVSITVYHVYIHRSEVPKAAIPAKKEDVKSVSLRFRKKKNVLESATKLSRAMLRVYAFQGLSMASMLLLYFRILENYSIIKTVYFETVILSIVLTGLALGSALYKRISEKPPNKYLTLATLQIITGFSAALSYAILNILSEKLYPLIHSTNNFTGILIRQGILFSVLLLIPALLTGLSFPLAGKLYPKRLQKIGGNFGRLGSILFLNTIAGMLFFAFILIPLIGVHYSYLCLVIMIILSGIYMIYSDSRLIRVFRLSYAFLTIILFLIMMGAFHMVNIKLKGPNNDRKIEGSTASISMMKHTDGSRSVSVNGKYYFGTDSNNLKAQQLAAYLPVLVNRNIQSALVIGFGTGITASKLEECGVNDIHITDIFPEVIRLSSDVFADDNVDIMTNSKVEITVEDARSYLIRTKEKTDLITLAAEQLNRMSTIYTTDFYQICSDKLSDHGLLCQILPTVGITGNEFRSILKSCAMVFPGMNIWYVSPEYTLLLAAKNEIRFGLCDLSSVFAAFNTNKSLTAIGIPDIESVLAHVLIDNSQIKLLTGDVPVNSDDKPFVEYYRNTIRVNDDEVLPMLRNKSINYSRLIYLEEDCFTDTSDFIKRVTKLNRILQLQDDPVSGLQK